MNPSPIRYDGLDLFRGISVCSVVLLHVHLLTGGDASDVILRVRDFAFPVLIMGSFFVMAVSFDQKPTRPFGALLRARVMRLLIPSLVWSYLHWIGWWMVRPLLLGEPAVLPPLSLALTAYMHLWFLHMVFGMTVVLAPVLGWVARGQLARWPVVAACLVATVGSAVWVEPRLLALIAHTDPALEPVTHPAPDLLHWIERLAPFLAYLPAGLAIGLLRRSIDRWYLSPAFRIGTLVAAGVSFAVHLSPMHVPLSREVYAIAVFLAILRPVTPRPFVWARALAQWSFVIYILHYSVAIVFASAFNWMGLVRTEWTSLGGALLVAATSLVAGVALRRILPVDWLLPLVPVAAKGNQRAHVAPGGHPSTPRERH